MDPTAPPTSGYEVPAAPPSGDMIPLTPEAGSAPAQPETATQPPAAPPASGLPATVANQPSATPPPLAVSHVPAISAQNATLMPSPAIANDLDLIEKEWVDKAKAIVAQNRTDPHAQNQQMNYFKADYMKKRYNKDIKLEK